MHAAQSGFGIAVAAAPLNENAMKQQPKEDRMGRGKGNAKRRFLAEKEDLTAVIIKRKHHHRPVSGNF